MQQFDASEVLTVAQQEQARGQALRAMRKRLEEQEELRRTLGDEEVERLDEDFLLALEHGMPPTGGLGMGLDRLTMILLGRSTIRDTLLFPLMRSRER